MTAATLEAPVQEFSPVGFHAGNMMTLASNKYPTLVGAIVECVQNAIDSDATHILVGFDRKKNCVEVIDNGMGVDVDTLEQAISLVGESIKGPTKLGKFGLGVFSPLTKCREFTFASDPIVGGGTTMWRFAQKKLQGAKVSIPRAPVKYPPKPSRPFTEYTTGEFGDVRWRTVVTMRGVTEDKGVGQVDIAKLEEDILFKLGLAMRQKGVKVRAVLFDKSGKARTKDIVPSAFEGEPFPVYTAHERDAGEVKIELYLAPKRNGNRSGVVLFKEAHNPSTLPTGKVARQANASNLGDHVKDIMGVLTSGYFEGTIQASGISMHEDREKFQLNDAMYGLYAALEKWYDDCGRSYYENEKEKNRDKRYQELGLKSWNRLHEVLHSPKHAELLNTVQSLFTYGTHGEGHLDPSKGRVLNGETKENVTRVGQGGAGKKRDNKNSKPASPRKSDHNGVDRPRDTPLGVLGPNGQKRKVVRGDSQGLLYEYSTMTGNPRLWELDIDYGVLTFNVRHPVWSELDETKGKHTPRNDKMIMHLQEWLTLQTLLLLTKHNGDKELFEEHRSYIDEQVRLYVDMFIKASR